MRLKINVVPMDKVLDVYPSHFPVEPVDVGELPIPAGFQQFHYSTDAPVIYRDARRAEVDAKGNCSQRPQMLRRQGDFITHRKRFQMTEKPLKSQEAESLTTAEIIQRLKNLRMKLKIEGSYVRANTVDLAIDEITRLEKAGKL